MSIFVKNKETLIFDDFIFRCSVGKKGISEKKTEGDLKTPRGNFKIGNLFLEKIGVKNLRQNLNVFQ